jgi:hypothetical protein
MRELMTDPEPVDGFTITFYARPEETDPADSFEFEKDIAAVRNGAVIWFWVECIASKAGVDLGRDTLGCCAYESFADFFTEGGYAADMRAEAIAEARTTLTKLCAEA